MAKDILMNRATAAGQLLASGSLGGGKLAHASQLCLATLSHLPEPLLRPKDVSWARMAKRGSLRKTVGALLKEGLQIPRQVSDNKPRSPN